MRSIPAMRVRTAPCGGLTRTSSVLKPCISRPSRPCLASSTEASTAPAPTHHIASMLGSTLMAASILLCSQPVMAQDNGVASKAVTEYVELENQGKFTKNGKALEDMRSKYRIRRGADGRLQLRSSRGEWFQVRLDMEVPGSMLLRDSKGYVFAIQTDAIQQIDLSDDLVALMMFADGEWEKQMSPVEYQDEKGGMMHLQLEPREFREMIGLLKEVQDLDDEKQQDQ